jgi:MFS family permease
LQPSQEAANKSALLIVFLVVVIDLLGFGIVLPLLPLYGDTYLSELFPGREGARARGAVLGFLMAMFSLMQFIFAPIWGRISDRIGRRPILLLGLVGSVVFYGLFAYASDLPAGEAAVLAVTLLFIARIGQGIAGANISTAQAVIADLTTPERRKHGMALIGMAFGIGFTIGPLVGFAALTWFPNHQGSVGYTAAVLSLISFLLGFVLLPETRRFDAAPLDRKWFNWKGMRIVLATPALAPVVLTFFLATLGFGSFEVTLSLLNQNALGLGKNQNFLIFAYVGTVLMVTQGGLYRRLAHRVSEATFMAAGIALMALGVASLGGVSWLSLLGKPDVAGGMAAGVGARLLPGSVPFGVLLACLLVSLSFAVIGFALLTPSAQALVSRRSDPSKQGEVLGVNQSAAALARILGPIFGLSLYELTPSHLLPYLFGAVLLLLMLPLIPRIRRGG